MRHMLRVADIGLILGLPHSALSAPATVPTRSSSSALATKASYINATRRSATAAALSGVTNRIVSEDP